MDDYLTWLLDPKSELHTPFVDVVAKRIDVLIDGCVSDIKAARREGRMIDAAAGRVRLTALRDAKKMCGPLS